VVIAIIATLVGILLPALANARRLAQTVACAANLHSICQAMRIYATEYNDYIAGSPWTSGYGYCGLAAAPPPGQRYDIVTDADWQSPLAKVMGILFDDGPAETDRMARFVQLMSYKGFTCPSNQFICPEYSQVGTGWPTITLPSYSTAWIFLEIPMGNDGQTPPTQTTSPHNVGENGGVCYWSPSGGQNNPQGYVPTISKVGNPSEKIFIADGGRYTEYSSPYPDYDPSVCEQTGSGPYGDQGAWTSFTRSWDRYWAPGANPSKTPNASSVDVRLFAYRHGSQLPFAQSDQMKMNCGFFDGHVQTMGDLQSANPSLWMPRNSSVYPTGQCYTDVLKFYFGNKIGTFSTPFIMD
jgi:prepilin-type processing-associated H-X9-DG protein